VIIADKLAESMLLCSLQKFKKICRFF